MAYDLRPFMQWIMTEFEPEVRVGPTAGCYARRRDEQFTHLYGVADMACVLYAMDALHPDAEEHASWRRELQALQDPESGYLLAKPADHGRLHNTAFALAAMNLLAIAPLYPLRFADAYLTPAAQQAFLASLDWYTNVYAHSHDGAGLPAALTLVPGTVPREWFTAYFALLDSYFVAENGMMGLEKSAAGDCDQIGGTFHYAFLYEHYHRRMPYPERRIDAILGLQLDSGEWHPLNPWWLTFDALYLLTRTVRFTPYRVDDVTRAARRVVAFCYERVMDAAFRNDPETTPHKLTAITAIFAEAQHFFGYDEIITDRPLRLVLDKRPFI
ncbi:MAG TPA: hypothetical protein VGL77_00360 [Armatimonadota bacterium]|jgi:hypothetical protein